MATHLGNNNEYHQAPFCSKCGKRMTLRDSDYGKFWGCTGYPECRGRQSYIDGDNLDLPIQLELELNPEEYSKEYQEAELRRIMKEEPKYDHEGEKWENDWAVKSEE
jgi:ssDNA-binding Zn-finger/Zn-ribbon topoisomerase 1